MGRLFGGFIQWKMSSNDELSSDISSSCDVESLQLAVEREIQEKKGGGPLGPSSKSAYGSLPTFVHCYPHNGTDLIPNPL